MKTTTTTKSNTTRLQSLLIAASIALPAGSLLAQDADKANERPTSNRAHEVSSESKDVEIFQGTLVSLHAYLIGADEADAPQVKTAAERKNATLPGRTADQARSQSSGDSGGPLGLIVNKEGFLGLGRDTEFYILTYDPQSNTSREAYARTVKFSRTGDFLDETGRDYVRSSANDAADKQQDLAKKNTKAEEPPIRDDDRFVRVTGEIVKRDNVEAIVVHSISPASRELKPLNRDERESESDETSDQTE